MTTESTEPKVLYSAVCVTVPHANDINKEHELHYYSVLKVSTKGGELFIETARQIINFNVNCWKSIILNKEPKSK